MLLQDLNPPILKSSTYQPSVSATVSGVEEGILLHAAHLRNADCTDPRPDMPGHPKRVEKTCGSNLVQDNNQESPRFLHYAIRNIP